MLGIRDTLASRIALSVLLTLLSTLALYGLFFAFGGRWSQPSPEETGMPDRIAVVIKLLEAAPAESRPALAAAGSGQKFQTDWYPVAPTPIPQDDSSRAAERARRVREILGLPGSRRIVAFRYDDALARSPALRWDRQSHPEAYFLEIELNDHSWLVFQARTRFWGLPEPARRSLGAAFLVLSTLLVSLWATHRLSAPIRSFADAATRFSAQPGNPAIEERGPLEIRQAIRAFNAMQARITRLVGARTDMLAAISHDLRTPLTRLRLRAEFVEDEEEQRKTLRDIDEMRSMIDAALTFLRDDRHSESATAIDLPVLLQGILDDQADLGREVAYAGPAHGVCTGQPLALKRAFTNLVDNAVKYGHRAEVSYIQSTAAITVRVADSGPGVPDDLHERLFAPFFRLENSRNRESGGVGLGLPIAQGIIRAHGGDISLANREEGGLMVTVSLPA